MGLFSKKKKVVETPMKDLMKFHGKGISYAVEMVNGEEINLGKQGGISVVGDEIVVLLNSHEVFRCKTKGAVACELMSGNGCDIKGIDPVTEKQRHIICFYAKRPH